MALAEGGVKYTLAQALTPNTPNARTSVPTRRKAAQTIALAPPGKCLVFSPGRGLENLQMKKPKMICEAKNEIPASAIVSDICSSIGAPWVEMSGAIHHVCRRMGIAEAIAITKIVTAKNFAMMPSHVAGYRSAFLALFQSNLFSISTRKANKNLDDQQRLRGSSSGNKRLRITPPIATKRDRQTTQLR